MTTFPRRSSVVVVACASAAAAVALSPFSLVSPPPASALLPRRGALFPVRPSSPSPFAFRRRRRLRPLRLSSPSSAADDDDVGGTIGTLEDESSFSREEEEGAAPTFGDARGAALLVSSLSLSRGPNPLLSGANLRVEPNSRWSIVGPNGCGKSTFLGAILGSVRIDDGTAIVGTKVRVGYLKQTAVSGSNRTVAEEAGSEMIEIVRAERDVERLRQKIADGDASDKTLRSLDRAAERFELAGGYSRDAEIDSVLSGLGFSPEDSQRSCSEFSGGWQMRIGLARSLLAKPNLLLLDEPSNHLDSAARDWLGKYLSKYDGSLVLVSHDVSLIEASTNNVAEIAGGTLSTYPGCSYSDYLKEKASRAERAKAEYERNAAEAERLQTFVDRFGASATKASSAQSRVKALERMEREGKLAPPPAAVAASTKRPSFRLPDPPKSAGETLVRLENASIGHDTNVPPLLSNVNLSVKRGMRIVLRGPNGSGKSTLMATLGGTLPLLEGKRIANDKLFLGEFTQDLAQRLDPSRRAIDLVLSHAREGPAGDFTIAEGDARTVMGRLGLGDDKPLRNISDLSGGEKARVALSMFALKPCNLLALDEPSNHLDVGSIEALRDALNDWDDDDKKKKGGAIVVVSHDRNFCESLTFTHVGTVRGDGTFVLEERDLRESDWDSYDLRSSSSSDAAVVDEGSSTGANSPTPEEANELRKRQRKAYNAPRRIAKLELAIEESERRISELDDAMMTHGTDVEKLTELTERREAERSKVDDMMEEWEELEILLEEFPPPS